MHSATTRVVCALVLTACFASSAGAQSVATSFGRLKDLLKTGEVVYITDKAGQETWGRVVDVSTSTVTVARMEQSADGSSTTVTADKRVFREDTVALIVRADPAGRKGAVIYPASWQRVEALRPGEKISVALESGERRHYRFVSAEPDRLRLLSTTGQPEEIARSRVASVTRHGVSDPAGNGTIVGALAGAGGGLAIVVIANASCGQNCNEPDNVAGLTAAFTAFAAGIGAFTGWLIDRTHKGAEQVFPVPPASASVGLSPIVAAGARGVLVSVRF